MYDRTQIGKDIETMKTTIRQGSFETNSSSTHSLTMMTPEQCDAVVNGAFLGIMTKDGIEEGKLYSIDDLYALGFNDDAIYDMNEWKIIGIADGYINEGLECDVNKLTTPGGEDVAILCIHGMCC